ncbi:sugar-binding transcriptional regulator [Frigidibacter sp. SD6-1]|uniref:sugar-binding transcriptional regulator n=1 Tax=Frigidibacter sp. SD6-1 TaxID=3032581 RepID=UPI0024DF64FF|nr:sugar-binding transcriptional regulator [Frigidibacter sp. SD6-1]
MRAPQEHVIHKAAWFYHIQGMRQEDIAEALGLSRATVINYLKRARDIGAVTIRVPAGLFRDDVLARRLEDGLGLKMVWVVPDGSDGPEVNFSQAAGMVLLDLVQPDSLMGLAWGETVFAMVDALPMTEVPGLSIVQMCGNLGTSFQYRPDYCTLEMARRLWAFGENLYAPLVLSSEELATAIRQEDTVRHQLERLRDCDLALFSVGSCGPESHVVKSGAVSPEELLLLMSRGAVAQVNARMIGADGAEIDCSYNRRLVAMELDDFRRIEKRLCLVSARDKVPALKAAIAGGHVSHLVVTTSVAADLGRDLMDPDQAS